MKKLYALGIIAAIALLLSLPAIRVNAQTSQCGGSFVPSINCLISGFWGYTHNDSISGLPVPFQASGFDVTGIVSKYVDLTNAQVIAANITPVTILPAPGNGKYYDVVSVSLAFNYTAVYTSVQNAKLYYTSRWAGNSASAEITGSGFFDNSADIIIRVAGTPDNTNPPTTNTPVVYQSVSAAAMGGGSASNSVRVTVNYRIVQTGL